MWCTNVPESKIAVCFTPGQDKHFEISAPNNRKIALNIISQIYLLYVLFVSQTQVFFTFHATQSDDLKFQATF